MAIHRRGHAPVRPSEELRHFTDREEPQQLFFEKLDLPESTHLPALMFYGVGGRGKTWLLKRLRERLRAEHPGLPHAFIDFDPKFGGRRFRTNTAELLGEIRRQLGVDCPRFDLAYAMMLYKGGTGDRPSLLGDSKLKGAGDFVAENLGSVMPLGIPISWLTGAFDRAAVKHQRTPLMDWLISKAGQEDRVALLGMTAQEICPLLILRLGEDLDEKLPVRAGKRCRAVIFLDTFETFATYALSETDRQRDESIARDLMLNLPGCLVVIAGQNRLDWEEIDDDWAKTDNLDQHLLGGLSRHDALDFLEKCGVAAGPLAETILAGSRDQPGADRSPAYFPNALGVWVDTVANLRHRGIEPDPSSLALETGAFSELASRFLKSLGDSVLARWLRHLAHTPRFDEIAARRCYSAALSVQQDVAWSRLQQFSFLQTSEEPGWFRLHNQMANALVRLTEDDAADATEHHTRWQEHWTSRVVSDGDDFTALAWSHHWILDPEEALKDWKQRVKTTRDRLEMKQHLDLTEWWALTEVEARLPTDESTAWALQTLALELKRATLGDRSKALHRSIAMSAAASKFFAESPFPNDSDRSKALRRSISRSDAASKIFDESPCPNDSAESLYKLGIDYHYCRYGDRDENLARAIGCYEAALRVCTELSFPSVWAKVQHHLGNAYLRLPTGDRDENLARAIGCYEAALRVWTESSFPSDWVTAQHNLGTAYLELETGDRGENMARAIACYEATLRVWTESSCPSNWASTQRSLAKAYCELPAGDRGENLARAIGCYEAALRVYTDSSSPSVCGENQNDLVLAHGDLPTGHHGAGDAREIRNFEALSRLSDEWWFPYLCAETQHDLGLAYSALPTGDPGANLTRAIGCFEAALRVLTESSFSDDWAMTQNNLGAALLRLPSDDRGEKLARAIGCFEAALRVLTESSFPSLWATTQYNLANAYVDLPTGDRGENLARAIDCFEAAMRVLTEASYPHQFTIVDSKIREAQRLLAEWEAGRGVKG